MFRQCSIVPASLIGLLLGAGLIPRSALAAPPEYAAGVTASNPLLWYRFDEASGSAINRGSLGAAFNASYAGLPERGVETPGGDVGVGLTQGDWLETTGTSSLTGNPTFSIEAVVWMQDLGAASNWGPFLHWGSGGTGKEVYFGVQRAANNRFYAGFYNAGIRTVDSYLGDLWLHVVWTRAGANNSEAGSTLYINGYPIATERDTSLSPGFLAAGSIAVTSTTFRINQATDFINNRYFTGVLDELALYNRILTIEEIQSRGSLFRCPSDYNANVTVDILDFLDFIDDFSTCEQAPGPCGAFGDADFNGDTIVDILDFLDFIDAFSTGC